MEAFSYFLKSWLVFMCTLYASSEHRQLSVSTRRKIVYIYAHVMQYGCASHTVWSAQNKKGDQLSVKVTLQN